MTDSIRQPSSLLEYLPAIYQEEIDQETGQPDAFLGQFLLAFERVLIGEDGPSPEYQSLEAMIANIATLFDPQQTPDEFLPWLASWTAFSMRADLDFDQQRDFLSKIIQLYSWRGTKKNMIELLAIFTKGKPKIIESGGNEFQIGFNSTIGEDAWLGGGPAHYFQVTISLTEADKAAEKMDTQAIERKLKIARDLIELEKPAHTFYDLTVNYPSMQIGEQSTLGVDTLLGSIPKAKGS
jgi:phage tail-like protein